MSSQNILEVYRIVQFESHPEVSLSMLCIMKIYPQQGLIRRFLVFIFLLQYKRLQETYRHARSEVAFTVDVLQ